MTASAASEAPGPDIGSTRPTAKPAASDYKPNAWQRLAAAGANFAAGYVNAGGRTRVDPNAMKSINNSLLRPKYQKTIKSYHIYRIRKQYIRCSQRCLSSLIDCSCCSLYSSLYSILLLGRKFQYL